MAGIQCLKTAAAIRRLIPSLPPFTQLLHLATTRSYATSAFATAQPQLDHDYYHHYYDKNQQKESEAIPMADTEGAFPMRGVQWVFIGKPGAKKHVYAEKVSKLLEVPHISIGSLVRQDLSPSSSLYKRIANAVNQGKLVPEDIMFGLLSKRLEDGYCKGETGFILDGIPRTHIQAEILDKLVDIDVVVNFKCAEDCSLEHHGDSVFSHSHQSDHFSGSGGGSFHVDSRGHKESIPFVMEKPLSTTSR